MGKYEIELSKEQEKALLTDMVSIEQWLSNAIQNKARQCIDKVVEEYSDKQASKITEAEKLQIVKDAKVKSAAERSAEIEKAES